MPRRQQENRWTSADAPVAPRPGMPRREFLGLAAATALATGCRGLGSVLPGGRGRKPNIVLIFADDLGYADLGCYGGRDPRTPHIDALAKAGVRCTSGYVTAPVCSPSRAGLLTGRYQQRFGHEENTGTPQRQEREPIGLPTSEKTIGDAMRAEGYATGIIGKWHQGVQDRYHPMRRGFDEFFGHLAGGHPYSRWNDEFAGPIYRGTEPVEGDEYLTDAFSREAVDFVRRHREEPFFLFLSYNAPHLPLDAPSKYVDRMSHVENKSRRTYLAMVAAVDDGVGRLTAALRELDLEDDTLVLFISDNGGVRGWGIGDNRPLRAGKVAMFEGGIRVPFIVKWPARLPAGAEYDEPVSTLDLLPTFLRAADGGLPKDRSIDGVDLTPHLNGENTAPPHDALFWRMGGPCAVRKGDWKLVQSPMQEPLLFNLAGDLGERDDLAERYPEVVEELLADYAEWEKQMIPGLWRWRVGGKKRK